MHNDKKACISSGMEMFYKVCYKKIRKIHKNPPVIGSLFGP